MFISSCGNTKLFGTTHQLTRLSTTTLCLSALLLTFRVTSLHITKFRPLSVQITPGRIREIMATSSPVSLECIAETASDTPSKLLLHEKDGSLFNRDKIGTKPFPAVNGLKIISWNVAGLRGTLKKSPEVLNELVDREKPDILCLQVILSLCCIICNSLEWRYCKWVAALKCTGLNVLMYRQTERHFPQ